MRRKRYRCKSFFYVSFWVAITKLFPSGKRSKVNSRQFHRLQFAKLCAGQVPSVRQCFQGARVGMVAKRSELVLKKYEIVYGMRQIAQEPLYFFFKEQIGLLVLRGLTGVTTLNGDEVKKCDAAF
jgi:hypothetical protein